MKPFMSNLKAVAVNARDLAAFILLTGSIAAWCIVLGA